MKYIKIKRIFESDVFKETPRIVSGDFNCYDKNLLTLMGGPEQVIKGSFLCGYNKLVNLEGAPIRVDKDFICTNNKLVTLKGAPRKIKGEFDCSNNNLVTLHDAPIKVGGVFWALNNKLTSLEGGPVEVEKDYHINDSTLVSLKGLPHYLRGKLFLPNHIEISKEDLYNKSKLKTESEMVEWLTANLGNGEKFPYIKGLFTDKFIKKNGHLFSIAEFDFLKKENT